MLILSSQKLNNTLICTNGILITAQKNKLRNDHNIIQDFVNLISQENFEPFIMPKNDTPFEHGGQTSPANK